jgi:GntR family transcriptional regulator, galactonate operon transcriptional repressor
MPQDVNDLTARVGQAGGDSLFRQITDRLATQIVAGAHEAGALVPAMDSLLDATVSRTAYREALKYLAAKGLIEARPKSGTRVAPRSSWNMLDPDVLRWSLAAKPDEPFIVQLFELRRIFEPQVARLAAERRSDEDVIRIERALRGMETERPFSEGNLAADLAFHVAIFDAAGNAPLACLKSVIGTTLVWGMRLQRGGDPAQFAAPLIDHRRVYEAIRGRDGAMAEAMTAVLVMHALTDVLRAFRSAAPHALDAASALNK